MQPQRPEHRRQVEPTPPPRPPRDVGTPWPAARRPPSGWQPCASRARPHPARPRADHTAPTASSRPVSSPRPGPPTTNQHSHRPGPLNGAPSAQQRLAGPPRPLVGVPHRRSQRRRAVVSGGRQAQFGDRAVTGPQRGVHEDDQVEQGEVAGSSQQDAGGTGHARPVPQLPGRRPGRTTDAQPRAAGVGLRTRRSSGSRPTSRLDRLESETSRLAVSGRKVVEAPRRCAASPESLSAVRYGLAAASLSRRPLGSQRQPVHPGR